MWRLALVILTSMSATSLAGCSWFQSRPAVTERPILDRMDPEIDELGRCVVIWDRACIAMRTRTIIAIRDAGRNL